MELMQILFIKKTILLISSWTDENSYIQIFV